MDSDLASIGGSLEIKTQVIRNIDGLAGLEVSWNAAVSASNNPSVFLSYEWFHAWVKNFAADLDLFILLAWKENNLVGIMPLHAVKHKRSATTLCSLSNPHTCKFDIVLPEQGSSEVLAAMLSRLNNELPWMRLELSYVPESAKNIALLETFPRTLIGGFRTECQMESPYAKIDTTWQDYLDSRDKKVRKNWDYFERKLNKEGQVEVVTITDTSSIDNMLQQAYAIEQASWKGDHGSAIANSTNTADFYHDLAQGMSRKGEFQLHFLRLDGKAIAFDYCLLHEDRYSVLKTGYDPAYSKSSPGRVLRKISLKRLYGDQRFHVYDLLGAKDAWKLEWADNFEALLHVEIYSARYPARMHYLYAKTKDLGLSKLRRHPKLLSLAKAGVMRLRSFKGRSN